MIGESFVHRYGWSTGIERNRGGTTGAEFARGLCDAGGAKPGFAGLRPAKIGFGPPASHKPRANSVPVVQPRFRAVLVDQPYGWLRQG